MIFMFLAPQGEREPIPLTNANQRIGEIGIRVDPEKIKAIVISEEPDAPSLIVHPDEETQRMANLLLISSVLKLKLDV